MPFCTGCGNNIAEGDRFCRVCGRDSAQPGPAVSVPVATAVSTTPPLPQGPPPTSGKAIGSLVCGLLFFFFPASVVAIILGHLSLSEIKKSAGRIGGEGMAIAGLVLGYAGVAFIPIILIIAAIAIPNLMRARIAANEASAVSNVRSLSLAEVSYSGNHPDSGFTCSLSDLAQDQLISSELASGAQHGYRFELSNCAPAADGGPNAKFQVIASPQKPKVSGNRAFCADESRVVMVEPEGSGRGCVQSGTPLSQ